MKPLSEGLETCRRCPRLVEHRERVAQEKRRAFRGESYWGRPVPGFGDPRARLILIGLAPGAHGSNRTGRMFTGDASGKFLYPALHRAGLATRPTSIAPGDGLKLRGLWITSAARCAPPGNRPRRDELAACRDWLVSDLTALPEARAILALGKIAHDAYLDLLRAEGHRVVKARHPFEHGATHQPPGGLPLLDSYHVSFQNTNTGRLSPEMFDEILASACHLVGIAPL